MAEASGVVGFEGADFDVFAIDGFAERMAALRARVRPKLVALAEDLAPRLSATLGAPLHPHVAAHMRRRVHPPPETWAAFGPEPRRYKAFAHYALGIDADGIWLRLVLKDEAAVDRRALASLLGTDPNLGDDLGRDMEVVAERSRRLASRAPDEDELARLVRKTDAQWAVGRRLGRGDGRLARAEGVEAAALETFGALAPLWRRLPSSPWQLR